MLLLLLAFAATAAHAELSLPKTSATREEMARHLLNRAAFGPRAGEAEQLAAPGKLEEWLAEQLKPAEDSPLLEKKLAALKTLSMSTEALLAKYPNLGAILKKTGEKPEAFDKKEFRQAHKAELPANIVYELAEEKILRAVENPRQLEEVLTDFWFNHFNVDMNKGLVKWYAPAYQREAIRKHVFGKFKDMLLATAHDPAMLFYLDNWLSVRNGFSPGRGVKALLGEKAVAKLPKGLNENYGRELMELHTLGVDGGYSQEDIISVARAFTGWTIEAPRKAGSFLFRPRPHDPSPVTVMGHKFQGGESEGEQVIEFLAAHPSTARFLSKKLCQRFVSEPAPAGCVDRLAKRYSETGGDLRELYRTLFTSPEFWNPKAAGTKVKRPFEFLVSALRAMGAEVVPTPLSPGRSLVKVMDALGEPLYRCAPPTGYKDEARAWVNTGALVGRLKVAAGLAAGRIEGVNWKIADLFLVAGSEEAEIDLVSRKITGHALSPETKETMEKILTGSDSAGDDWELRRGQRAQFLALLLGSPEFQKR